MEQEVILDETFLSEEPVEPFDWEDYLYEAWLEEHLQKKRRKTAEAGA